MDKFLLNHIKEIELTLQKTKQKEEKLKKITQNLKTMCQSVLDVNNLNKDIKDKIIKYLNVLNTNLEVKDTGKIYNQKGFLDKNIFFEIIKKIDFKKNIFFIFRLRDSKEIEFGCSFIESKFTPYFVLNVNKVFGILEKDKLKEFEKTKFIPFFDGGKYQELEFFVVFFEVDDIDEIVVKKATNIFERFYLKPSFNDKSFVHYSLIENKIIDFEAIKKKEIKKQFGFIENLKYPELELMTRKEINNIKFLLALLDRIDTELKDIKNSKGTIIVVKRILSFIHKNQIDKQIQEMTELISQELDREETISPKR